MFARTKIMLGGSGYNNKKEEGGIEEMKISRHNGNLSKIDAQEHQAIKFDWCDKWLKGEEYYHILTHADLYAKVYSFKKYPPKTHPPTTYTSPTSTSLLNHY